MPVARTASEGRGPIAHAAPAGNDAGRGTSGEPVIVLSYACAGAGELIRLLSASPSLVCTSGIGLLPLCHSAAGVWQQVDGQSATPSALAITSIRAMTKAMATVLQSETGATRWCETAYASPAAAGTFLRVFPQAAFLIVHRSLQGVLTEAAQSHPWGLGGSPFWLYAGPHPGNNAATVAAYWGACTDGLLGFETANPHACLRIRYEDLIANPGPYAARIRARLGLPGSDLTAPDNPPAPSSRTETGAAGAEPPMPMAQLPPHLLAKVRELHAKLDYVFP